MAQRAQPDSPGPTPSFRSGNGWDPLFTVVIPCFNGAATLEEALRSVREQTCQNYEILVVDDGSTDSSCELVKAQRKHDLRLRLIRQPRQGPSVARNRGIETARGELIAFLDVDDRWHPEKLARHARQFAEDPSVGVGFGAVMRLSPDGQVLTRVRVPSHLSVEDLLSGNVTCTMSNVVARRVVFDDVGGFDDAMYYAEDLDWLVRVAQHRQWKIQGLRTVSTYYRQSPGGLSSRPSRMESGWHRLALRAADRAPKEILPLLPRAQVSQWLYLARRALDSGQISKSWTYWRRAAGARPWALRRHVAYLSRFLVDQGRRLLKRSVDMETPPSPPAPPEAPPVPPAPPPTVTLTLMPGDEGGRGRVNPHLEPQWTVQGP